MKQKGFIEIEIVVLVFIFIVMFMLFILSIAEDKNRTTRHLKCLEWTEQVANTADVETKVKLLQKCME